MKKAKIKINTVYIIVFILFGAYALSICYTFLWGVVAGLMEDNNVFILHPFEVPSKFVFKNYVQDFTMVKSGKTSMLGMLFNSVWYTVGATVLSVACSTTMAYVVN